jgi:protein-S-isoprenylcysteine O-methyltransferase Ste14
MIVPTLPNAILLLLLGGVFVHFMVAGSRTFHFKEDEPGGWIGQFSFLVTGTMATWGLGIRLPIPPANQVTAGLVLMSSLSLYEWARRTIWGRRFGLGWGEHVPETLCEDGPYRYVRHPLYVSYVLAFLAVFIALPHWITTITLLFNLALFVDVARRDERVIAASALAASYAAYRERTGMFLPRISRAAPGR